MEIQIITLKNDCANRICTNKQGQGTFALVRLRMLAGKEIELLMCGSCADELQADITLTKD